MTAFKLMNMSNYEYGTVFKTEDHTHGSIKDGDSMQGKYVWEGGDVDRMLEYTFNGSRIEVRPGPTNLKGSWNPSADIVNQSTAFFPHGAAPSEPTIVEKTVARLKEAGINLFFRPGDSASDLANLLVKGFYNAEITNPGGGHDVLLLLADCIAELNASIQKPEDLCRCMNSMDGVSNANAFFPDMYRHCAGALFFGEVWHTHATPADLYTLKIKVTSRGPCIHSRPRLTPFGALSELPRLLPENKTKVQLEAIDAMYELIGSPWKVWP